MSGTRRRQRIMIIGPGRSASGGGSNFAQRLLSGGAIASGALVFSRAQAGGAVSTRLLSDGVTWEEVAADVPRRHGAKQLLIIEDQRTNQNPNPRFEPSAAGLPTGYSTSAPDAGLTYTYAAQSTFNGVQGKELAVSGTTAGTVTSPMFRTLVAAASQVAGNVWAASRFLRFVGGSYTGLTGSTPAYRSTGGTGTVVAPQVPSDGALYRQVLILTSAGTPADLVGHQRLQFTAGAAINVTMFNGWEQAELGAFASTPILPPVGAPAASTRGADNATTALSAIGTGGSFSLALGFEVPALPPSGQDFTVLSVNDGTANNQLRLRVTSAGALIPSYVVAGAATDLASLGTITAGTTRRRVGISWDASAGTFRAVLNGGGDQNATALTALSALLTTLRFGAGPGGVNAGGLLFADADAFPAVLISTGLTDAVAALPT